MKWLILCMVALFVVTPAMAGEDPYIGIFGNEGGFEPDELQDVLSRFYFSPKYLQFFYDFAYLNLEPGDFGFQDTALPSTDEIDDNGNPIDLLPNNFVFGYPPFDEYFHCQSSITQPEICDVTETIEGAGFVNDNLTCRSTANSAATLEWRIMIPKAPSGEINICIQCGVTKPNAQAIAGSLVPGGINLCAAETGERVGPNCSRLPTDPGENPIVNTVLPAITATAYPGPYNDFTPFTLTAFKNPGTYVLSLNNTAPAPPIDQRRMTDSASLQLLDGSAGARVLLKACMDKCIVAKLPVTGQLNAAGEVESDLTAGDFIVVTMTIPRNHRVDIYCGPMSTRIMGVGEAP